MRVGSFNIAGEFVRNDPKMCARLMSEMCIVRCEFIYATDRFHYEAIHDGFDDLIPGKVIPHYVLTVSDGILVGVKRVSEVDHVHNS